jgi:glycerate 2-kinase
MIRNNINILIAPNSMKGSLTAFEFADIVEEAFMQVSPCFSVRKLPVADGGDGTGEVLFRALDAEVVKEKVVDALGRTIHSKYAVTGKTAIIEMADASGVKHLKAEELNPLKASSFGTGQLIKKALEKGCTQIWLGAGGSATVDGGSGLMEALGFQLLDEKKNPVGGNGLNTGIISQIIWPEKLPEVSFKVISDVDNPLLGESGAAAVFGPQKGAGTEMVLQLEKNLEHWSRVLELDSGRSLATLKGAGAAGGMALPLLAYFNAELVPGAEFVLSALDFKKHLAWADIVITGEGKIDSQTLRNKAPKVVANMAREAGKTVIALGGSIEPEACTIFNGGAFSILPGPVDVKNSIINAKKYLSSFSAELAKLLSVSC